jgi:RNA polymerase sigma factor (sigma-70 family)
MSTAGLLVARIGPGTTPVRAASAEPRVDIPDPPILVHPPPEEPSFEAFVADASLRLRRALVARYGVELGVEACAEAIAWAWAHRERLATMSNPVGYLYRVGQTAVRRQARWERTPPLPREEHDADLALPDPALHDALAKLNRDQRAAVMLVHAYGYPYAEAAALLDIPVSTLKNHLNRGAAKLRRMLESSR